MHYEGSVYQLPVGISRWAHPGSVESPIAALYIAQLFKSASFTWPTGEPSLSAGPFFRGHAEGACAYPKLS